MQPGTSAKRWENIAVILIILVGIAIRFYCCFINPCFNIDEIPLAEAVVAHNGLDLIQPFENFQSAPPLYILIQKLIISNFPFSRIVNLKILSFLSSSLSLIVFSYFLRKQKLAYYLVPVTIFAFNAFIIYHTCTFKQYSFDLLGILISLSILSSGKRKWAFGLCLSVFVLLSNIMLFFTAAYLLVTFFQDKAYTSPSAFTRYIKENISALIAPLPYVVFFVWFSSQPGAAPLKAYMVEFWTNYQGFVPLGFSFFKFIALLGGAIALQLLNGYIILALLLCIVILVGIFRFKKTASGFLVKAIYILIITFLVHASFSALKLYPLYQRFILYVTPLLCILLCIGLQQTMQFLKQKWNWINPNYVYGLMIIVLAASYYTYTPYNPRNIPKLYDEITINKLYLKPIYADSSAYFYIQSSNRLTNYGKTSRDIIIKNAEKDSVEVGAVYIAVNSRRFGPQGRTYPFYGLTKNYLDQKRIKPMGKVDGFVIFEVVK